MRELENASETDDGEVPVRFGISVNSYSPPMALDGETVEEIRDGNHESYAEALEEWWDELSLEERAEVLSLDDKDGSHAVENLFCIDRVTPEGNYLEQPLWER